MSEGDISYDGSEEAVGILTSFGSGNALAPREGEAMLVLGTGRIAELTSEGICDYTWAELYYQGDSLPDPIKLNRVSDSDNCLSDPSLVGTGDCSNSIWGQFSQGQIAHDYAEVRVQTVVPDHATAVMFDFAFLSTEYPEWYGQEFNDMFLVWLESERWTGNISFDGEGNPISLNAGFLDFKDDEGTLPAFEGTCLQGHASTRWLTTSASVTPGEMITLVFALFDMGDGRYDSFVLLDNFRWGCDESEGPATTPGGTTGGTSDGATGD